jgi:hypothetical protein
MTIPLTPPILGLKTNKDISLLKIDGRQPPIVDFTGNYYLLPIVGFCEDYLLPVVAAEEDLEEIPIDHFLILAKYISNNKVYLKPLTDKNFFKKSFPKGVFIQNHVDNKKAALPILSKNQIIALCFNQQVIYWASPAWQMSPEAGDRFLGNRTYEDSFRKEKLFYLGEPKNG